MSLRTKESLQHDIEIISSDVDNLASFIYSDSPGDNDFIKSDINLAKIQLRIALAYQDILKMRMDLRED